MTDTLVNLVDSNIQFSQVLSYILIYLGILWVLFSVWVFLDAKKRYGKTYIAALFGSLVLILNFPLLIFYLIVRPETEEEYFVHSEEHEFNTLNLPIANFISEKGIEMSLNLKINNSLITKELNKENVKLNINIGEAEVKVAEKIQPVMEATTIGETEIIKSQKDTLKKLFSQSKNKAKSLKSQMAKKPKTVSSEDKSKVKSVKL